ncbi:MAG: ATP-binding cassette domain-containing protein [Gammaproteobacteria bacterium]|nr:ATP-binding cassette domain-containing protein [Gammaproteobacteria bacterium]MDH5311664.1 ATP-binding cassette domain-containing protein [Gammaproteobacteria bacterium]
MAATDGQAREAAAQFDRVSLRRGSVDALRDITLSLPRRQITAILGESGSGKSTLIQLIIGLLRPDSGTVRTLGETIDYDRPRGLRKRIGYAVQDVALFPHLIIRTNVLLPATLAGWPIPEAEQRLHELLDLVHLPAGVLDRYPHQLSGGQQQRAGLCRAMMLRPELLLLDEPFSGLDSVTRQSIHQSFLDLQRHEPISSVLVTHEPQEAINLADYMVVMQGGTVMQHGTVADVVKNPASEYVNRLCRGLEAQPE